MLAWSGKRDGKAASHEFDNTGLPLHMLSPALFSTQLLAAFQFFSLSTVHLLALYRSVLLTPPFIFTPSTFQFFSLSTVQFFSLSTFQFFSLSTFCKYIQVPIDLLSTPTTFTYPEVSLRDIPLLASHIGI
jgi:hypothetical protein